MISDMNGQYVQSGTIVDIVNQRIFRGTLEVEGGNIVSVREEPVADNFYILPGLVDARIHVESSMLVPSEFARMAVVHGTVAAVSDPHEIANVLGVAGVRFMIDNASAVPFKFFFGAPSCVPATEFETAGGRLGPEEIEKLLNMAEICYLSEMMNFPGVLDRDPLVMAKLGLAREKGLPIDGHAPGLMGQAVRTYADNGITSDHECSNMEEALEKINAGMKIQIREGSAARNFDALVDLLQDYPDQVMFCSDDKHPDELLAGHIDGLVRRALRRGYDPLKVLRSAVYNPVSHYNLDVGMLQEGDPADYIVVDNLEKFTVLETRIDGIKVAENGRTCLEPVQVRAQNKFNASFICAEDISAPVAGKKIRVQKARDGQLLTSCETTVPRIEGDEVVSDPRRDILKIVAVNRYNQAPPVVGFASGFGLKQGAIASSVAHDSHNIIAIGVGDGDIVQAVNLVIEHQGGISFAAGKEGEVLPLPVAGLMSPDCGPDVARRYKSIDALAKQAGSPLRSPYMTLSFMALLVIPALKISDRGLFDGTTFSFTPLFLAADG